MRCKPRPWGIKPVPAPLVRRFVGSGGGFGPVDNGTAIGSSKRFLFLFINADGGGSMQRRQGSGSRDRKREPADKAARAGGVCPVSFRDRERSG